ncbi:MAG TPA: hypothetical protein VKV40_09365 [Ktedonobacteraceae bacterium]|nr:hypothetical protein [Ktedonobacteraceae bacterium]
MELLVITLAQLLPGKEADGQARIRLIANTVRVAPGLVTSLFYRSRGDDGYYLLLTTWEDESFWIQAQERHSPRRLLLASPVELLTAPPEQWLMHYSWGYSRPAAKPMIAAAHLATIRPDQAELAQRGWIESLRRQAVQPTLAFAFLARGVKDETSWLSNPAQPAISVANGALAESPYQHGPIFLNLLSWASESEREDFYAHPNYKVIQRFLNSIGTIQTLALEPLDDEDS